MGTAERFAQKTELGPGDCWLWTGARQPNGYGRFKADGRTMMAHRFAYERARGPVPIGLELDHVCRTRHCVNPDHLEPVTPRENIRRGIGVGAVAADLMRRRTHCPQGHVYDEANTRRYLETRLHRTSNRRHCRACDRERRRRSRASA